MNPVLTGTQAFPARSQHPQGPASSLHHGTGGLTQGQEQGAPGVSSLPCCRSTEWAEAAPASLEAGRGDSHHEPASVISVRGGPRN